MSLLVVAGEGSGDALAAPVVAALNADAFGLGGPVLAAAGLRPVADVGTVAAMGVTAVARHAGQLASAFVRLSLAVRARRPRAALLVGFSEPNALLARWLKRQGIPTLWYAPPQVWAWRPGRARALSRVCDGLALLLPFERAIWKEAGAHATYVGHPAGALPRLPSPTASTRPEVALLPGSREQEIAVLLGPMLSAARILGLPARVVLAPGLRAEVRQAATRAAVAAGAAPTEGPLSVALRGASAAITCSGTATLECAALGVPPLIVYRTDPLTYAVARRLVRVPHVGLPNLVLGRRAFPELLQEAVSADRIAAALGGLLETLSPARGACDEVREALTHGLTAPPALAVAHLLRPWLR